MIDATKLENLRSYYFKSELLPRYRIGLYDEGGEQFLTFGGEYLLDSATDCIPIPTPDELAAMREVIRDVANNEPAFYGIDDCYAELQMTRANFDKPIELTKGRDDEQ
jgi:hypothetical protein